MQEIWKQWRLDSYLAFSVSMDKRRSTPIQQKACTILYISSSLALACCIHTGPKDKVR